MDGTSSPDLNVVSATYHSVPEDIQTGTALTYSIPMYPKIRVILILLMN
jgi:hypothetical protein